MTVATLGAKLASVVAQIILGHLLSDDDYGLYAIAIAVAIVARAMQNGGTDRYLQSRDPQQFSQMAGPAFWLGTSFNGIAAVMLSALAWPIAQWWNEPQLVWLLWVIAGSLLLQSPASVLLAGLHVDLEYRAVSRIMMISAIARQVLTIGFALLGFGPLSFVLPLLALPIIESVLALMVRPRHPWKDASPRSVIITLLRDTRWLMLAALAMGLSLQGDYLIISTIVDTAIVGTYFFAYQLIAQVGALVSNNLRTVLVPILARMNTDPERQGSAVLRSLRALFLFMPFITLGLAVVIPSMEYLIWEGKWAGAVIPVMLLALSIPFRATLGVMNAALLATSRFRVFLAMLVIQTAGMMTGAVIGATTGGTAAAIALGIVIADLLLCPLLILWNLSPYRISLRKLAAGMFTGPGLAVLCAAAAYGIGSVVLPQLRLFGGQVDRIQLVFEFLLLGTTYSILYLGIVRIMLVSHLRQIARVLPDRLGAAMRRILRLGPA